MPLILRVRGRPRGYDKSTFRRQILPLAFDLAKALDEVQWSDRLDPRPSSTVSNKLLYLSLPRSSRPPPDGIRGPVAGQWPAGGRPVAGRRRAAGAPVAGRWLAWPDVAGHRPDWSAGGRTGRSPSGVAGQRPAWPALAGLRSAPASSGGPRHLQRTAPTAYVVIRRTEALPLTASIAWSAPHAEQTDRPAQHPRCRCASRAAAAAPLLCLRRRRV